MNKKLKSYFSFTRTERIGFISLCLLVVILIAVWASLNFRKHKEIPKENDLHLSAEWEKAKQIQPKDDSTPPDTTSYPEPIKSNKSEVALPVIYEQLDINTIDSFTLSRINGISTATAGKIVSFRYTHGPFSNMERLQSIAGISNKELKILYKNLVISNNNNKLSPAVK